MFSTGTLDIDLNAVQGDFYETSHELGDDYFRSFGATDIRSGKINARLSIRKTGGNAFSLAVRVDGSVTVLCDRCLDDMEQPVSGEGLYTVVLGAEPGNDGETITVDERKGILSAAWPVYETAVLAIPIKHVHAPGKCNDAMTRKLEELSATRSGDEEAAPATDPRWAELSKLRQ